MIWCAQLAAIHSGDDCQMFGTGPMLLLSVGVGDWYIFCAGFAVTMMLVVGQEIKRVNQT